MTINRNVCDAPLELRPFLQEGVESSVTFQGAVLHALHSIQQHRVLPGLDNTTLYAIADLLESKSFQFTGNPMLDFKNAHAQIMAEKNRVCGTLCLVFRAWRERGRIEFYKWRAAQ